MRRWHTRRGAFQEVSYYLLTVTDSQVTPLPPLAARVPFASSVLFQQSSIFLDQLTLCLHTCTLLDVSCHYSINLSLVPRPHPRRDPADPSGFINVDYFLERNFSPPIRLQKTQSVGATPKSLGYFSTMTQHFFGA